MRYLVVFLLATCVFAGFAHATAQIPDTLVLDGEEVPLHTNPLQPYLHAHRDELPEFRPSSTANWRGYVATFAIRDDLLIVDKVEVRVYEDAADETRPESRMEDIIGQLFDGRDDVPATWYSGALVVPRGELVHYVHMGYGSTYERYTVLRVQQGRIVERLDLTADEFTAYRKERFDAFKATPEYAAMLAQATSGEHPLEPGDAEEFIYQYAVEQYLARDPD